jgi:hypothetical protein
MWNEPTKEQLANIPELYQTEEVDLADKVIQAHFFLGNCDWYIVEYDGEDLLFGYAILGGDLEMGEWGYISFSELQKLKTPQGIEVDFDLYWKPVKAGEISAIRTT